jgi:hypothetical protein
VSTGDHVRAAVGVLLIAFLLVLATGCSRAAPRTAPAPTNYVEVENNTSDRAVIVVFRPGYTPTRLGVVAPVQTAKFPLPATVGGTVILGASIGGYRLFSEEIPLFAPGTILWELSPTGRNTVWANR